MRHWLVIILIISFFGSRAAAQKPFLSGTPLRITTSEIYDERLYVPFPGDDPIPGANYQFTINITATVDPADAALFDESTNVKFTVADFSFDELLGNDENFDSTVVGKNRSAEFRFEAFDVNSDTFRNGVVTVNWDEPIGTDPTQLRIIATFNTLSSGVQHFFDAKIEPEYALFAFRSHVVVAPEPDIDDKGFAEVTFGPYSASALSYYVVGSSTATGDDFLVRLTLSGSTDDLKPTGAITFPVSRSILFVPTAVLTGTTKDIYRIGTTVYNSFSPPDLEFFLHSNNQLPTAPDWVTATVGDTLDTNGNRSWASPSAVTLNPGANYLFLRITDTDGNSFVASPRFFQYSTQGKVSLTGTSSGFPVEANGKVVGTVSGEGVVFPNPIKISVKYNASASPLEDGRQNVEAGRIGIAVAKPGTGAIFDGWTATFDGAPFALDPQEAVKERMEFFTRPKLVVVGRFIPNPFLTSGSGTYFGAVDGTTALERGTFLGKVSKNGAFTGKVLVGPLSLSVKGKFLGSGLWTGIVTKKGVPYTITLNVTVSGAPQQITGTVTGDNLNSTITADFSPWVNKTHEATAYVGTYNVLLPATGTVPEGVGYGQVTIDKLGKVKFVGQTGNGTAISFSSTLFERSATEVVFPFFVSVEKGLGNIAGIVQYDATQPDSDLTGTLAWSKPTTLKIEPAAIDGQIALHGSKYNKPAAGTRVILTATGAGMLNIHSPSFTTPPTGATTFLSTAVTLQTSNALAPVTNSNSVQNVTFKFSPATGLFTGKFFDPGLRKTFNFSGAATQQANGGVGTAAGLFIRGNRTGYITLTP